MKNSLAKLTTALFLALLFRPALEARQVTLEDFRLVGNLADGQAGFTLSATARVTDHKGGSLELLSGAVALTEVGSHRKWSVRVENQRYFLVFDRAGKFPIQLRFAAAVQSTDGWSSVEFGTAPGALRPLVLEGLPADTQFNFPDGARPERVGNCFESFLPADGQVKLLWREATPEAAGKLFFSSELLSQISVSPGLMRQIALLDFKIMQGEMNQVSLRLRGAGEVTRVQGDSVLSWSLDPVPGSADRRLVVRLNEAQKRQFTLQVQVETPLGAFPQSAEPVRLLPEGTTRLAGYFRIVNEGAVRLEVAQATGLSQISPEQFPETDATRSVLRPTGSQRFAYRFSGADFGLRIQADQILPEVDVSELLAYTLGEHELAIEAELELDVREAPLRELLLRLPKGYGLAQLKASSLSDYFLHDTDDQSELRLVFAQPLSGRQLIQFRLERNQALSGASWKLPRVEVVKARSVRGHLAVAADAGFRLTPQSTEGLTEIATAFYPRKLAGMQTAFRLSEPEWEATMRVERLPQTVQADVLHLFSVGEGIAYGSSIINYTISGAPVSAFKVELSAEYFNVEFTGKDLRNWQKVDGGYLVQLHTPVSGSYTLLASYERPFKAQGETLTFTGARPLDAQSEQGHTLVISAYQFAVKPVEVSPGLLPLETGEVPPEYRLFFDAPILAAYRYSARPFNLKLALSPLVQGDSLSQVVDRAKLTTHVSKQGQVLTDARYFVKNRGNPNLRLMVPAGTELWSAAINGSPVVPVMDGSAELIPLPQGGDPNTALALDLKLASRATVSDHLTLAAPMVGAPVMLAEWKVEPDTGQRLVYRSGSLTPAGGVADTSGFAQLVRSLGGEGSGRAVGLLVIGLVLVAAALVGLRWAGQPGGHRFDRRQLGGLLLGLLALSLAAVVISELGHVFDEYRVTVPRDLTFVAPVQQAGSALSVEVLNTAEGTSWLGWLGYGWPVGVAIAVWCYGWWSEVAWRKGACRMAGWMLLAWAALRYPNGAIAFLAVVGGFLVLQGLLPLLARAWRLPSVPKPASPGVAGSAATAVTTLLIGGGLCWLGLAAGGVKAEPVPVGQVVAANKMSHRGREPLLGVADSVYQQIHVEGRFGLASAKIHWPAERGQVLPLLWQPAVLTALTYPSNALELTWGEAGAAGMPRLLARRSGNFDIELRYQMAVTNRGTDAGLTLPAQPGLVNKVELTLQNLAVDVLSPEAVAVQTAAAGSNTVARLTLSPAPAAWVGWKPRTREPQHEKPVFYAELSQLYVPAAGVIEGVHWVSIRPAQGELSDLVFDLPAGAAITDVVAPAAGEANGQTAPYVSAWRFEPDTHKLRVTLSPAQSRSFVVMVRSQFPAGPLPFEQTLGLLRVENAAGQMGLLGLATGNEVQLDKVNAQAFSPINLEDFPGALLAPLQGQIAGLTLRRAFRGVGEASLANNTASKPLRFTVAASAVEPDVRVESAETLSLGEDRTVLAADLNVNITRAGIFRLSFVMPPGFDVESLTGAALSHWTEARNGNDRVITLQLRGKTEGAQQFSLSLAGPGVRATNHWDTPQLLVREASKQHGTILLVPEQGLRLQVAASQGFTQLDPEKSGINQKGVLAFRMLQTPGVLALDLERVDPWVQVTSLQNVTVSEARLKTEANLRYQIENAGLRVLHILIPTNAEGVRFQGEQVADFLAVQGSETNGMQAWEVRLQRRALGDLLLQVSYQIPLPDKSSEVGLRGIEATKVNLQRGFVTIQAGDRLQVNIDTLPVALQPAEWQSIPRTLSQGLAAAAANFSFRLVEPEFELRLRLERHQAVKLLAAHVNDITFHSVVCDDGVMLTHVRLDLLPGDKRLLYLTLPADAHFWFAFVNNNGVWPWREQDRILIPLEQQSRGQQVVPVELFYTCPAGRPGRGRGDWELLAPKFDLPLENITWRVSLDEKWLLDSWTGSLQLQRQQELPQSSATDLQTYLHDEAAQQRERTRQAEDLLAAGNSALAKGEPLLARRAFQAAYGMSAHDAAFNEDARVQLHNLKLQQALLGLNVRQAAATAGPEKLTGKLRELRDRRELSYTQQDAKDILDRNSADDNAAFMRLAERLIQQQDASVSGPAALRASVPDEGRVLTFKRSVLVDPWAALSLHLRTAAASEASGSVRLLILMGALVIFAILGWAGRTAKAQV